MAYGSRTVRYLIVLALVGAGAALRVAIANVAGQGPLAMAPFYPAVVAGTLWAGYPAGLLAAGLSAAAGLAWQPPPGWPSTAAGWVPIELFLLVSIALVALCEAGRRAQRSARTAQSWPAALAALIGRPPGTAWRIGSVASTEAGAAGRDAEALGGQQLPEAEVREFYALLSIMPVGIGVAHDPQCREILVNAEFARMLGVPAGECGMLTALRTDAPYRVRREGRDVPRSELPIPCAAATGREVRGAEFDIVRADGTLVRVLGHAAPLFDGQGRVRGSIGGFLDITERRHGEDALRESEGLLRAVVETAVDGIITIDERGTIRTINPAGERIFGYSRDEVVGRNVSMLMPEPYRSEHDRYVRNYLETGQRKIIGIGREVSGRRKDGSTFPMDLAVSETRLGQRRIFTGLVRDITQRKAAEDERSRLLANERAARSEVERQSRLKDEFLATLSHELRTPLNAVLGWAQLLRRRAPDARTLAEGLETIERNARAQTQLIEDLLDMSRIVAGKVRLDVQRVHLESVIEAALDTVRPTAEAKGVTLHAVLDPDAGPISGDPARLQQVVWNLLTNAIKFTPRGGHVEVVLERTGSQVEVSVTDTGQGIAAEFLPHVFERFRQADATTTRHHGGLGLGLAIVRHLVELHGGTVSASSPGEGRGATFVIKLPPSALRFPEEDGERIHPTAAPTLAGTDAPGLDGVRVLVVDDEADARTLVRRVLEERHAAVLTAGSVPEALATFDEHQPDVLVCDIGMPEQDGYDLIRLIRARPPTAGGRTPAVSLTAFARAEDRIRALRSGYQMHVAKPVEASELVTVVASLAGKT